MVRKKLAEKPISTRKLTRKQKGFVKDYIATGIGEIAAKRNYNLGKLGGKQLDNTARSIASENLTKPNIIKSIQEYLPDTLLSQVHLDGLQATKRSGTGGMLLNVEEGDFGHTDIDEPDFNVRSKYLDMAYKLKGSYAAEKSVTFQVNFTPDPHTVALANKYEEELKKAAS